MGYCTLALPPITVEQQQHFWTTEPLSIVNVSVDTHPQSADSHQGESLLYLQCRTNAVHFHPQSIRHWSCCQTCSSPWSHLDLQLKPLPVDEVCPALYSHLEGREYILLLDLHENFCQYSIFHTPKLIRGFIMNYVLNHTGINRTGMFIQIIHWPSAQSRTLTSQQMRGAPTLPVL